MSLRIVTAAGLVTVQDLGRPGHMHEALPRGGALVPELLVAANHAVGNRAGAAALEVLGRLVVRAEAAITVATDRGAPRALAAGEELGVESEPRRVTYLALRGGVDAPLVLGSRSAQLSAGLGARLRAGDAIAPGVDATSARPATPLPDDDAPIRLVAGPDHDAFAAGALAVLCRAPYRILPTSDRVGTRLAGLAIPRTDAPEHSRPMVRGALEVPRDGQPIVLGPEHPTTGGYPVLAVIVHADLGRFFARRLGGAVRFVVSSR